MSSGRHLFRVFEPIMRMICAVLRLLPFKLRVLLLFPFLWSKGYIGITARNLLYTSSFRCSGRTLFVAKHVVMKNLENISVGDNVSIHEFCYFDGAGGISLGDNVAIAHSCSILSTNHTWGDPDLPIKYNPVTSAAVNIADDVWIGCGVRILAGVTIGPRTVIAAGAVVTRSLTGNALYAGIPARKVRDI